MVIEGRSGPLGDGSPDEAKPRVATGLRRSPVERGPQPGTSYVRISHAHGDKLRRVRAGHVRATERAYEGHGWFDRLQRVLVGRRISTAEAHHERLSKVKALAVFSSDAISSSAYATQEILLVLAAAGAAALSGFTLPVGIAIVALLAVVSFSYRQTIRAYPHGGGSYIVTKDNLGEVPSLVAAASLMIDYTLTVAVSISAGVLAVTSAFPAMQPFSVELAISFILLIVLGNLRGLSESGSIFAAPTYVFIAVWLVTFGVLGYRYLTVGLEPIGPGFAAAQAAEPLALLLVLRAFASGCAALTGVEAISDGVPAFKPVEWKNAQLTLIAMAVVLGVLFFGMTLAAVALQALPVEDGESVPSQIARAAWGEGPMYLLVQAATTLILVLAANTAFADFPRLNYFLARDDYMPHYFQFRGDRLAFTTGISVLAAMAIGLVVAFDADVSALIPLYAIGVFVSFTLSQASVARRWWTRREPGWAASLPVNVLGAVTTAVVAVIIAVTKFEHGAWAVIFLIPVFVLLMKGIHRHYAALNGDLAVDPATYTLPKQVEQLVLVPVSGLNRATLEAVAYARSISDRAQAVHVTDDPSTVRDLRAQWEQLKINVPLVILESPYRSLSKPLLAYIDALDAEEEATDDLPVTVVLPEFVPRYPWEYLLHNQSAFRLKARLFFRPHTVVVNVPYHLRRTAPDHADQAAK